MIRKVDIGKGTYRNVGDVSTRDGFSPLLVNGYYTEAGTLRVRKGLQTFANLNSGGSVVQGVYWSDVLNKLFAVSNGKLYSIDANGNETLIGSGMNSSQRAVFASDNDRTFIATGTDLYYTDGFTLSKITTYSFTADFVEFMDNYMIAGKRGEKYN